MQGSNRSPALIAPTLALWAVLPSVALAQGYSASVCAQGRGGITLNKDKGFNAMTVPYLHTMLPPAGAKAVIGLGGI